MSEIEPLDGYETFNGGLSRQVRVGELGVPFRDIPHTLLCTAISIIDSEATYVSLFRKAGYRTGDPKLERIGELPSKPNGCRSQ